jgi:hypothetical protein
MEVLMAIFIGAIVVGIVNTAFFRSHHSMEIVNAQRQTYQMVRIVMDRVFKDLTCAYVPSPAPGEDALQLTDEEISMYRFTGKDDAKEDIALDTVHFTTTTDLGLPGSKGGAGEVGYYLKEMEGKKDRYVLIRSEDYLPHEGVSEDPREMEMAEDIVSLNIKYVDEQGNEQDTWDLSGALTLPREVKVTVTFDIEGKPMSFSGVAFLPLSGIKLQKKPQGTTP